MRVEEISGMEINAKVELIQTLIPLGLMHVEEELMREVERLESALKSRTDAQPSAELLCVGAGSAFANFNGEYGGTAVKLLIKKN
jgi:hypothetical protein